MKRTTDIPVVLLVLLLLSILSTTTTVFSLGWKQQQSQHHRFLLSKQQSTTTRSSRSSSTGSKSYFDSNSRQQQQASNYVIQRRGGATTELKSSETLDNIGISSSGTNDATTNNNNSGVAVPLTQTNLLDEYREKPLMDNINLLSNILSNLVNNENSKVHDLYEEFRQLGTDRAIDPNNVNALHKMIKRASQLSTSDAIGVIRTFSVMLNLVNSAEVHHRTRITKQFHLLSSSSTDDSNNNDNDEGSTSKIGPLPKLEDSMSGTLDTLLKSGKFTKEQIYNQLLKQKVEIVLTAHPTQVQRKSLLRKYRKVSDTLAVLDRNDLITYERYTANNELKRIISTIWGADEIRRTKPTPQKEAAGGNAILENVLWDAVPNYLRKLEIECYNYLSIHLPITECPIKFTSWIGGDRDGNPNVTPDVTLEVILQQRLRAAKLYINDLNQLFSHLAISARFSKEMEVLAETIPNSTHKREKYRRVVGYLIDQLIQTARSCEKQLLQLLGPNNNDDGNTFHDYNTDINNNQYISNVEPLLDDKDLLEPLLIMHRSLIETGFDLVADGLLVDVIRRVQVFGLSLIPLDIREESGKHAEVMDEITRWLGIGSYSEWNEETKITWLVNELTSKRPLFPATDNVQRDLNWSASVAKTLQVFHVISQLHPTSLEAYVISQAQTASDVLAVMLLQKQYGMTPENNNNMRVVPLFETLNDLVNAPDVLKTLFSIPYYVGAVNNKQEVMVGYSDSAKDAGRLAACWALYNSQELMATVATKYNVELTFFHGKGGTVGRGGNPSVYRAIMSHPPKTINGRFRVTEQGEMITQNFGTVYVAERTLDTYTAAVCREYFSEHVEPTSEWREQMQRVSDVSCADYRHMVQDEPRFVPYFRQATPELELSTLNIGSRPAKRNPKGGVESLRAIPWTFAWTQTRVHLSAWLGVGIALKGDSESDMVTLRTMYKEWPWFRETVDLISMIVSKTDFSISKNYDDQLVDKTVRNLGEEIRDKLVETRRAVLDVTESKDVAGAHVALQRASSRIRNPYIDPVNVIQAELLKRSRALETRGENELNDKEIKELDALRDGIVISINAIAQGMKNSG